MAGVLTEAMSRGNAARRQILDFLDSPAEFMKQWGAQLAEDQKSRFPGPSSAPSSPEHEEAAKRAIEDFLGVGMMAPGARFLRPGEYKILTPFRNLFNRRPELQKQFEQANMMRLKGAPKEEITAATGYHILPEKRGAETAYLHFPGAAEDLNRAAVEELLAQGKGARIRLSDILPRESAPDLYKMYPSANDAVIENSGLGSGVRGYLQHIPRDMREIPGGGRMPSSVVGLSEEVLKNPTEARATLAHELTHFGQKESGTASGYDARSAYRKLLRREEEAPDIIRALALKTGRPHQEVAQDVLDMMLKENIINPDYAFAIPGRYEKFANKAASAATDAGVALSRAPESRLIDALIAAQRPPVDFEAARLTGRMTGNDAAVQLYQRVVGELPAFHAAGYYRFPTAHLMGPGDKGVPISAESIGDMVPVRGVPTKFHPTPGRRIADPYSMVLPEDLDEIAQFIDRFKY